MSSGFVSSGTADAPIERSDEWLAAQQEIEANRRRKLEEGRQNSGRSLYETLEANKAAKQEAFEESIKLKNQFRALDADEVEFLDSVLESTRAEEERVRKETAEGLEEFRKRQEEADRKALGASRADEGSPTGEDGAEDAEWTAGVGGRKRKRKEQHEGLLKGVKIRRQSTASEGVKEERKGLGQGNSGAVVPRTEEEVTSTSEKKISPDAQSTSGASAKSAAPPIPIVQAKKMPASSPKPALVLVDYDSDSDA